MVLPKFAVPTGQQPVNKLVKEVIVRNTSDLPDKERLLVYLITELCSTQLMTGGFRRDWKRVGNDSEYVHFEFTDYEDLKVGDLVCCQTSGIHAFTIGYIVAKTDPDWHGCTIREIGSSRTCNISNESFYAIRGLDEPWTWEGDDYQFYCKVVKAFWKTGDDWYRFGGLKFNDDGTATMTVREKFGGALGTDQESVPFDVTTKWAPKMSIKSIVQVLKDGGVGTRKFERRPTGKPADNGRHILIEF